METAKLKKFAQFARRSLIEQVSAKLKLVLTENSAARRESTEVIKKLEEAIKVHGKEQVIERVAYIWFNRFCALRFMDVNRYNRVNVVSPADPGQFQPEILAEAKMGHIDEEMVQDKVRQQIFALLDGKAPSRDPQGEAYRLLVVAACNFWNKAMPFLFQRIDDYTELLMPDDLLSGNSILAYTREAMTPDACEDVEVIGWLYQFYISEKKDEVFDGLKKNKKITPENIPAATQLFTPHWIVRYLVENSLGRLWLLNRPNSRIFKKMKEQGEDCYYIEPTEPETDFLKINRPEEIKICDPACGSGHMLTYAFDLLYAIYEEEGYEPAEIPEKILTNNLYGIEIDERAGELAAFALTMKARAKQRRFYNKGVKPNICVLENVHFGEGEINEVFSDQWLVASGASREDILHDLNLFEEADNFGSLVRPRLSSEQCAKLRDYLTGHWSLATSHSLFDSMTHQKALKALRQADYLSPKYHVVIANPPYMGGKGMNARLKAYLSVEYEKYKSDLFSAFIARINELGLKNNYAGLMTPFVWMFISSHEALRRFLFEHNTILSLVKPSYTAFFQSAIVPICAFILRGGAIKSYRAEYFDLGYLGNAEDQPQRFIDAKSGKRENSRYRRSIEDLEQLPGCPIAFWATDTQLALFSNPPIKKYAEFKEGITTGNNDLFLRYWHEVSNDLVSFPHNCDLTQRHWAPYNKGGAFRKWYGNNEYVVSWSDDGQKLKDFPGSSFRNASYHFKRGATFSAISSSNFGVRYSGAGYAFDSKGTMLFSDETLERMVSYMNSKVFAGLIKLVSPTMDFRFGTIQNLPYLEKGNVDFSDIVGLTKKDWDSYETSWDFTNLPLLNHNYRQPTLKATYQKLLAHWREMTLEMQRLEEENNRIFIDAYGLQDELTPEVPLNEITLTCNPYYRYGKEDLTAKNAKDAKEDQDNNFRDFSAFRGSKDFPYDGELEAKLLADTMRELVSYAVGCMFGRYALDKPGLTLANQGETIEDYYKTLLTAKNAKDAKEDQDYNFRDFSAFRGSIAFPADEDNVIPMLDGDWFTDDISERFREFLKVAFGAEHYEENLRFVESALGKDIRKYFLKDFYSDHVRRYKKRPIYWLFSSPKGSFNALIYMHRYRPDTVSVVLNDYLREFRTKITSHKNHLEAVSISSSSSQSEKTKALKEIEKITKMITEMEEYEREVLYPLATEQVVFDLDDGVKINYPKLGAALKKIVGLDAAED